MLSATTIVLLTLTISALYVTRVVSRKLRSAPRRDRFGRQNNQVPAILRIVAITVACVATSDSVVVAQSETDLSDISSMPRLHLVAPMSVLGAHGIQPTDLDGDGDLDLITTSPDAGKVYFHENVGDGAGAAGRFSVPVTLTREAIRPTSLLTVDVNGDGKKDLVFVDRQTADSRSTRIRWMEKTGVGNPTTFLAPRTLVDKLGRVSVLRKMDVGGSSSPDLVYRDTNRGLVWIEMTERGLSGDPLEINGDVRFSDAASADLNGDGQRDLVVALPGDDRISWLKRTGSGQFAEPETIARLRAPLSVTAADLDGDDDRDLAVAATEGYSQQVVTIETIGDGSFGDLSVVDGETEDPVVITTADLDNDGNLDLLVGAQSQGYRSPGSVLAYNNQGDGTFTAPLTVTNKVVAIRSLQAADLDGDGSVDPIAASEKTPAANHHIAWYPNRLSDTGAFGDPEVLSPLGTVQIAESVAAGDIDGDGRTDIVSTSRRDRRVHWSRNRLQDTTQIGSFSPPASITKAERRTAAIAVGDVDGDGDIDVLSASRGEAALGWHENTGTDAAKGRQFASASPIDPQAQAPVSVATGDVEQDDDLDVLWTSRRANKVFWSINSGGGSFETRIVAADDASGIESAIPTDIDGDGDLDVLSYGRSVQARYHENTGGAFSGSASVADGIEGAWAVTAADLDADGDQDIVVAGRRDASAGMGFSSQSGRRMALVWHENQGGGSFGEEREIEPEIYGVQEVEAADVTGDGRLDIAFASSNGSGFYVQSEAFGNVTFGDKKVFTQEASFDLIPAPLTSQGTNDLVVGLENSIRYLPTQQLRSQ